MDRLSGDTALNDQVLACVELSKAGFWEGWVSMFDMDAVPPGALAGAVEMYCKATMVADEASRNGFRDLARSLETTISGFLKAMPREQQARALQLSYELALGGVEPAPPRLRLAYSRD